VVKICLDSNEVQESYETTRFTQENNEEIKLKKRNPRLPIGGGQARLLSTKEGWQVVKIL